ncbi:MAG: S8 family serine peptidase, partial [Acidimicrobiia bacterium]|nr:S8 family serine peptidase [Acidimicrobiia bacterium]
MKPRTQTTTLMWLLLVVFGLAVSAAAQPPLPADSAESYIVQVADGHDAVSIVGATGGSVTHQLGIIGAVAADLTVVQHLRLEEDPAVERIWINGLAELTGKPDRKTTSKSEVVETHYPAHLGADALHLAGIDGSGVTIAILDSGIFRDNGLTKSPLGSDRVLTEYDPVVDKVSTTSFSEDDHGHGSHVTSIAASSRVTSDGNYNGMAPGADLLVIRAFDASGSATYADIVRGLDWVLANKDRFGIRILNCSFSATAQSFYW